MHYQNFADMLKAIMQRNKLSQRALAKQAEVDHVGLCRILKANYPYKPGRTIHKLVQHVGCTAEERVQLYRLARVIPPEYLEAFIQGRLKIVENARCGEGR
jgi:hypothetical protein